jgi:predicted tellurium resistance membrane protein TerC
MEWIDWIFEPQAWIALATLTALELVLGIDNIVFISILAGKLPPGERSRARRIGLAFAMLMRIALLLSLAWVIRLTAPLFSVLGNDFSGRDLILILGGLFLIAKATHEIHQKLEGTPEHGPAKGAASFRGVIVQIVLIDAVFSLDSVITAVGMVRQIPVMVLAIVLAVLFMMWFARPLGDFVERHPTVKMLALSFLLLVGTALIADGFEIHIPRGYIYFAMGYSIFVEMLNLRLRKRPGEPVRLHGRFAEES